MLNLACFDSVAGHIDGALDLMERAIELGFLYREWYMTDSDLANIRANPRFDEIMNEKFKEA